MPSRSSSNRRFLGCLVQVRWSRPRTAEELTAHDAIVPPWSRLGRQDRSVEWAGPDPVAGRRVRGTGSGATRTGESAPVWRGLSRAAGRDYGLFIAHG